MHLRMKAALHSASVDWNHLKSFLATAEAGTLSAAARGLGLTQPTLGRQVRALERALGLPLFERSGKALLLTRAGRDLLEHVRSMEEAAARVALSAAGHAQDVEGEVTVSASDAFCAYLLSGFARRLRSEAPGIVLGLAAENRLSDLRRREADIAIRHVRPQDPELIGRRMPDARAGLYAATDWIVRNGRPAHLDDLAGVALIGMDRPAEMRAQLARHGVPHAGLPIPVFSQSSVVVWEMVRAGLGISLMADAVAARTPGVEELVVEGFPPIVFPVWLVAHRELYSSRRIRLVFDLLADEIAGWSRPAT
jgi:DNA-binding transcriptional LysR family regulator